MEIVKMDIAKAIDLLFYRYYCYGLIRIVYWQIKKKPPSYFLMAKAHRLTM